jgi:hypothetical protein
LTDNTDYLIWRRRNFNDNSLDPTYILEHPTE